MFPSRFRRARFSSAFFAMIVFTVIVFTVIALAAPLCAQLAGSARRPASNKSDPQSKSEAEKETIARRQTALALLDTVLAGAKNLSLPQNRIAIACEAFPVLWSRNQPQARALVNQMTGDFGQAASRQQENPDPNSRQALHQQWQMVLRTISQSDAELALSFMNASHSFVQIGDPEQEEAEERSLRLELATREAAQNPRNALRMAEKDLQAPGDLPQELINLQSQVAAHDAEAGTQLLHEIVTRVRGANLASGEADFQFALNLVNAQFNAATNAPTPDETLKTLAESVVSAALSPQFPQTTLPNLQGYMPNLEQFAPGPAQALSQKLTEYLRTITPEETASDAVAQAQTSGDPNQILAAAEQAPAEVRSNLYQQAAWQLANRGDLQRARQVADNLPDSFQRNQVVQQAIRQSAWQACSQGQFAAARQLAEQMMPEEDRAIMLAQFATNAAAAKQEALAQEMVEEAGGLLANRAPSAAVFAAQLQVAQAFVHLKPERALPLLDRSANQLGQVLAAVVEVDAFFPYHSFEDGELILNNGFLFNSLVEPYLQATAELANSDLPAARILADRIPFPEARLMAELSVARAVLGESSGVATVTIGRNFRRRRLQ
ncbi:MAG TPA: hypothetical protein VIW68_07955 [Candidatus Sulfotelmatobacter sp.]